MKTRTIPGSPTNDSFGHNTAYARAAASTEDDFILEDVALEDSRRVDNGVSTRTQLSHFDDGSNTKWGCCCYCQRRPAYKPQLRFRLPALTGPAIVRGPEN